MGFWIRGKIGGEQQPAEPLLIRIYHPLLLKVLHWPKTTLLIAAVDLTVILAA